MIEYIKRDSLLDDILRKHCNDCAMRKNANGKTVYSIGDAPCRVCWIADVVDDIENYPAAVVRANCPDLCPCEINTMAKLHEVMTA